MSMNEYIHKVPCGKMLRVRMSVEDGRITAFRLLGDFFLYPEEGISVVEKALIGKAKGEVAAAVERAIRDGGLTFFGIAGDDIAATVMQGF